jgi:hypothetical protein
LYYSIKISISVLRTAAKVIMRNMRMVIVPITGFIIVTAYLAFSIWFLLYLMSCGEITVHTQFGVSYYTYDWTNEQKWMIACSCFFFFWCIAFMLAATQYILIVACVSWYFTENEHTRGSFSIWRGYWWTIRYNMGSLLFGSFIIAMVCMIRAIFEYINKKIQSSINSGNPVPAPIQWTLRCCRCCLDCCHRFIKYINLNAYCQVALTGDSFCMSALNGFCLILKNSGAFMFTGGLGSLFNIVGKLFVSICNVFLCYLALIEFPEISGELNSPVGPLIVVFLISYCIAYIFMGMYTTTATCLLHCLFADIDICNTLSYDQMVGRNRPHEMKSIVKVLSRPTMSPSTSPNRTSPDER